jgi:hypothetical protein
MRMVRLLAQTKSSDQAVPHAAALVFLSAGVCVY